MSLPVTARSLQYHNCDDQRLMNGTTDLSPVGPATRPDGDAETFHSVFSSCVTPQGRANGACVPTYADCLCKTCDRYAYITPADLRQVSTVPFCIQDALNCTLRTRYLRTAAVPPRHPEGPLPGVPALWTAGLTTHRQHTCTAPRTPSGVCHRAELQRSAQFQNLAGPPGEGPSRAGGQQAH